jgi:hypothetical protein
MSNWDAELSGRPNSLADHFWAYLNEERTEIERVTKQFVNVSVGVRELERIRWRKLITNPILLRAAGRGRFRTYD